MKLGTGEIIIMFLLVVVLICLVYAWRLSSVRQFIGGAIERKNLVQHPRTKSEQFVVDIFEKITGKSFPTVYLPWLKWKGRKMELDGYNDELKLAVEFSGPLHTKFYSDKETYAKYKERIDKDREKLRLCKKHGVHLIVIDMSIPQRHMYSYVHSRLWDLGIAKEKPWNYMPEMIAEPYENPQMEEKK